MKQTLEEKRNYFRKWRELNQDKIKEYQKKYSSKPRDKSKDRERNVKKYYANREAIISQVQQYYQEHKQQKKEYNRKYREKNKNILKAKRDAKRNELNEKNRIYRNNPEVKEKEKIYRKEYKARNRNKIKEYEKTPWVKISINLRTRIRRVLKTFGCKKSNKLIELCGCTSEFLKKHLESKFKEGMTWDNYGTYGWHIDHIVPCSLFDLTKEWQQKSCFKYENLEPCWQMDNLKKNNKLEVCPV